MPNKPESPECEKLASVSEKSKKIGEFLDWLDSNGIRLSEFRRPEGLTQEQLFIVRKSKDQILADYFEIDLNKVEEEHREILEYIRAENERLNSPVTKAAPADPKPVPVNYALVVLQEIVMLSFILVVIVSSPILFVSYFVWGVIEKRQSPVDYAVDSYSEFIKHFFNRTK